ncbi:MAG: glutamine--tRNA ligase/YqeY domain fusion protein [Xanthomonadales bacterium]|nr:glutamine--tRNA ligase/YqeY domain fusion protein [Xanthomonadales bacterium]
MSAAPQDFIRELIRADLAAGRHQRVHTRFPPEPNGYLHIGHARSICLNFGVAQEFGGRCNLRYDDTNPAKEEREYIEAIREDVAWLGYRWDALRHASDYFEVFYLAAERLILEGKAYVCDLSQEEMRALRGTLTEPGRDSPYRDRPVAENLELFRRMRAGEFPDGSRTLRARIDMRSGNLNLRDPALYRIKHLPHPHTGEAWCIYPMYDFAHALSDAIEGITHSLCTLEFEDHRPLYDWCIDNVRLHERPELLAPLRARGILDQPSRPRQIEFARLNLSHTLLSKRKLLRLVQEGLVEGWDDPRLPTLRGLRRRGVPPEAIRLFVERLGISKQNALIDHGVLEGAVREVLDRAAERRFAVLRPLRLVLENWPEGHVEEVTLPNHPKDPTRGERRLPVGRELWIEREDFAVRPPPGFHRLVPGGEVRLRGLGIARCTGFHEDRTGGVAAVSVVLDPASRPGAPGAERKVRGTIHWLSARHACAARFRLYDRLFAEADPETAGEEPPALNPRSLEELEGFIEPGLASVSPESRFQFERLGYFVADRVLHRPARPVFNRIVTLRDGWGGGHG